MPEAKIEEEESSGPVVAVPEAKIEEEESSGPVVAETVAPTNVNSPPTDDEPVPANNRPDISAPIEGEESSQAENPKDSDNVVQKESEDAGGLIDGIIDDIEGEESEDDVPPPDDESNVSPRPPPPGTILEPGQPTQGAIPMSDFFRCERGG